MVRKNLTSEQIINKLREDEIHINLARGQSMTQSCATLYVRRFYA